MIRYYVNLPRNRFLLDIMRGMICWRKHSSIKDHRVHIVRKNHENFVLENTRKSQEKSGILILFVLFYLAQGLVLKGS